MAKTKASDQPARRCDLCGFTNKNAYIFKRHRLRCRRDKKKLKGGITKLKIKPSGASLVGSSLGSYSSPVKVVKENGISKRISPSNSPFKRNRTYKCEDCNYSTIKSKAFLYHEIHQHNKAYSIFTCTQCEYSSKHRHKVQRHLKLVHKKDVDLSEIKVEFENESTQATEEQVVSENNDPRFKYNIDMSSGMDEQIPDDVVVVLPEAPEGPSESQDHVMEVPGIEGKVYKCEYCLFNSNDKSKVAKHVVTNHLNAKMFQCTMCSFTTGRKIEFVAHKAKHRKLPALQCNDCSYATDNKQNFDRHRENHKADHMYRCQFCSFSSSKEAAITRHLQTSHENSAENMQILAQGASFTGPDYVEQPPNLQQEMSIVPPAAGRNFVMGVQNTGTEQYYTHNQTFSHSPSMDFTYNNTDLMSGYSDNNMNWSQDKNNSFKYSPSPAPAPAKRGEKLASKQAAILQGADGSFVCPLCGLKYKRSSDLNRHMKQKHEIRMKDYLDQQPTMVQPQPLDLPPPPPPPPPPEMLPPPPPLIPAPHQQENIEMKQNEYHSMNDNIPQLDNQIQSADENFGEISLKCSYCPYEAKWPGDIRKHLAIHQIERRYRCPHCEKQYKYVGDLNVHIRKDHKREPEYGDLLRVPTIPHKKSSPTVFKCPSCPFSSQWKSEVDRHSKCHGENKPYKCNFCEYQTHWKGDIRRHMYNHHPEIMGDHTQLDNVITIDYEKLAASKDLTYNMENSMNSSYENNTSIEILNDTPENSMDQSYELMNHSYEQMSQGFGQSDMSFMDSEPSSVEPSPIKEGTPTDDTGSTEQTTFKCEYCTFVTNAPSKLKAHVSTHMNLKQYMCPICGRRANWKWDIRKHIKKSHPETGLDVIKLSRQEAEATIAKYLNSNPVVRREHHLNVTVNQPNTITDENLDIKNGKMFKCGGCGYESNQRWIVSKHIRTVHANADVSIIYKGGRDSQRTMMNIQPTETPVQPDIIIDDRIENSSPIQTTILNVPMINNEAREMQQKSKEGEKPFICMDCGKQCASKADIARHYYYMHRNMAVKVGYISENGVIPLEKDDPGPKTVLPSKPMQKVNETSPEKFLPLDIKPFMCAECGKRAALKGDVKKHYNYMHPGSEVRIVYVGDNKMENGMIESPYLIGKPPEGMEERPYTPKMGKPKAAGLASANPKSFGYTKPFMCSECGRRSNWKWDLSKHMRMRHPGSTAHIITLSEAEARATYESYMQEFSQSVHTSPVKKHPSTKANEKEYQLINFNRSAYRQFKCSACPYRSNWRSDLLRHIKRKHGVTKGHLIILTIDEAKESLTTYDYNPRKRRRSGVFGSNNGESGGEDGSSKLKGPKSEADKMGRIWKCARCSFVNKDKMVVARHLYSSHRIRAFTCSKCHYATNHRSSAYRHIKQRHETENISICKIGIKYIRYDPSRHTYVKSAIEKAKAEGINVDISSAAGVGENGQLFPGWENNEVLTDENLKLEEDVEDEQMESVDEGTDEEDEKDEVQDTYVFKETFQCRLCTFQSSWRSCVCRHIRQKHKSTNYQRHIKSIKKIVKNNNLEEEDKKNESQKQYLCTVCPYRTAKNNLLTLHMNCHKPQLGVQQEKCRYCPYYVKAPRLIQQHERLHLEEERKKVDAEEVPAPPTPTKDDSVFTQPITPSKRYQCQKCPYRTNSKSDFFYHKQFHRPKPSAEYKCDECDYWVGLKRLLKQHKKVHEADYNDRRSSTSSLQSSPCKSDFSESSYVYDSVQLAMYKQKVISSKIQPSISHSPVMSPMKIACTVGNRPGYVMKNGGYRKVHKCSKCPYQNIRLRNLKLHELMHGYRKSKNQLMKCPDCDYYVGSKGLLSHHMKVHLPGYMAEAEEKSGADVDVDEITGDDTEKDSDISEIMFETKVDTLYEIARFKKYSCEKCPYASAKRSHYEKHVELHGSKQRHTCKYCDYSVPSRNLLVQHERLHCTPNQNLLAIQSLSNLLQLPEVPADVALASALPPIDTKQSHKVSVTHDHIDLYENSNQFDIEPKKLYRCDRCPYANVRRDHLLTHLKFHMLKSVLACPYCDYSVSKQHHLAQHIRVHFCPLPELSNWLAENGQLDRVKQSKDPDISEALFVAQLFKRDGDKELEKEKYDKTKETGDDRDNEKTSMNVNDEKQENGITDNDLTPEKENKPIVPTKSPDSDTDHEISFKDSSIVISPSVDKVKCEEKKEEVDTHTRETDDTVKLNGENGDVKNDNYICQYCDREFDQSDILVQHEMQHLIGNNYEVYLNQFASTQEDEMKKESELENSCITGNGDIGVTSAITKNDSITENGSIAENGDIPEEIPNDNGIENMEVEETKENTSVNS